MELQGTMGNLYRASTWITRMAFVNMLWILFTLVGLIIFGIIPATVAMFAVVRKWVNGDEEIDVFKTYWFYYRTEFVKANFLGLILLLFGYAMYFNFSLLAHQSGMFYIILGFVLIVAFFLYLLVLLFFFPVYVHFELTVYQYLTYPFLIAVARPVETIGMAVAGSSLYFVFMKLPGLLLFFSGSVISLVLMFIANRAFSKIDKQNDHTQSYTG
ncbi:YesL family protein [Alteribacter populi]|uniref:YesL family protein n=1 Tax=Alteribacter populi TaxID=2011011 RepID=UPI000BBB44F2|nr:YesL family protein [Alteribacter populi]